MFLCILLVYMYVLRLPSASRFPVSSAPVDLSSLCVADCLERINALVNCVALTFKFDSIILQNRLMMAALAKCAY